MKRLIIAEYKKLFKSKINFIILIILIGYSCLQCYQEFHSVSDLYPATGFTLADIDGNPVDETNYWKFADKTHHAYAGELNSALVQRIKKDEDKFMRDYASKEIDRSFMESIYGKNFEQNLKNAKAGAYSAKEIDELFPNYMKMSKSQGLFYEPIEGSNKIKPQLESFYQEDHVRSLYQKVYDVFDYERENKYGYLLTDSLQNWIKINTFNDLEASNLMPTRGVATNDTLKQFYANRLKQAPKQYDSNIGNTLLVNSLKGIQYFTLIGIILMLSNLFAVEKHYKTDQIITPCKNGTRKLVLAKLCTGFSLSLGILIAQVSLIFLMSFIFVPIRDLNLMYFIQAGARIGNLAEFVYSYQEILINGILLMSIASLATACITMFLSYLSKNRFTTVVPLLAITLITGMMQFFTMIFSNTVIDQFFPAQMFQFTQFYEFSLIATGAMIHYFTIGDTMIAWKDIIMICWIVIIFILSGLIYFHSRKHVVKNC